MKLKPAGHSISAFMPHTGALPLETGAIEPVTKMLWLALALSMAGILPSAAASEPPQYVLISFDGAHDLRQWERSRALGQAANARFTYFFSCTFLLSPETRSFYRGPGMAAGRSNIGFAASRQEVAERLHQIWQAVQEGHELANHGCGHFDGKDWTAAEWTSEIRDFTRFLRDAYKLNEIPGEPAGWDNLADQVIGFRAPYLSTNAALFRTLAGEGFQYDASAVTHDPAAPKVKSGLYRFALPMIPEGPAGRRVIAMDYNLFVRHSGGEEDPQRAAEFSERTVQALMAAFDREFSGKRRPLQIGLHFTLMNGGAYWDALERFASDICLREEVRCVTHLEYLRETGQAAPQG